MSDVYYLATYYGGKENWVLEEYESLDEILELMKKGELHGAKHMVLKEVDIRLEEVSDE